MKYVKTGNSELAKTVNFHIKKLKN